jgi:hypothetical protein
MKSKLNTSKVSLVAAAAVAGACIIGSMFTGKAVAQAPAAAPKTGPSAGEYFKNVTTPSLKVLPVADFMTSMGVISADLGLDCADCHPGAGTDHVNWTIDTAPKIRARKMIEMVGAINKTNFNGAQMVTCWTCHHGRMTPASSITLDKLYGTPNDEHDDLVTQAPGEPTGAQVIDKYIAAIGGAQKLAGITSFIATGTSLGYEGLGGGGAFQIFAKAPDMRTTSITFKDHPERGDSTRTYNGKTGWVKQPRAAVAEYEYTGSELDGVRMDALLLFPGNLKTDLKGLRTNTADLGDKDAELVQGSGPGGTLVTLYFDKKTNLLVRYVRFTKTPAGRAPVQIDYDDYRDVNGVKFPFKYTFSWLDGKDTFEIKDVKTNVTIDPAIFGKPK